MHRAGDDACSMRTVGRNSIPTMGSHEHPALLLATQEVQARVMHPVLTQPPVSLN